MSKPVKPLKRARRPDRVVEMLWFDPESTGKLRRSWRRECEDLLFRPKDDRHDVDAPPAEARDHHLHFGILTEVEPATRNELVAAIDAAVDEHGRFTPPLLVVRGTLELPFDPIEELRAMAAVIKPLCSEDKKVTEALEQVDQVLDSTWMTGTSEAIRRMNRHLRKAYRDGRRILTLDYVDETVQRALLEKRCYQKRRLFGGSCIRAELKPDGGAESLPTYMPEELAETLPMLEKFETRMIAEAHFKQDEQESHSYALKVVTLGRVMRMKLR